MNFFEGKITKDGKKYVTQDFEFELDAKRQELLRNYKGKEVILGVRPEHIIQDTSKDAFECNINLVELLGSEYYVHLDFIENKEILVKVEADKKLYANEKLSVTFKKQFVHIFDPITSKTIF